MYYAFMAPDKPAPRANRYRYFIRVDKLMEEAYDDAFIYDWGAASRQHRSRSGSAVRTLFSAVDIAEATFSLGSI